MMLLARHAGIRMTRSVVTLQHKMMMHGQRKRLPLLIWDRSQGECDNGSGDTIHQKRDGLRATRAKRVTAGVPDEEHQRPEKVTHSLTERLEAIDAENEAEKVYDQSSYNHI